MNKPANDKPETMEMIRNKLNANKSKIERNAKRIELAVRSTAGKKQERVILEK